AGDRSEPDRQNDPDETRAQLLEVLEDRHAPLRAATCPAEQTAPPALRRVTTWDQTHALDGARRARRIALRHERRVVRIELVVLGHTGVRLRRSHLRVLRIDRRRRQLTMERLGRVAKLL